MPRLKTLAPEVQQAPGAFMPDGSWNADAELHHRGHVHRLVAGLVHGRRDGTLTPQRAARMAENASAAAAFPNHAQWATCDSWTLAWTSTAAEQATKHEGRGANGHWCGERWAASPERECQDQRHRMQARPELIAATFNAVLASAEPGDA